MLLLTTQQLCNIDGNEIKRSIKLENIQALTKNTGSTKTEFLLHVKDEYDYRFKCSKLQELSESIKEVYFNLMNDNLQIFGVNKNITSYMTTKND